MERLGADDIIVGKRPRGYPADELHDFAEVSPSHVCVHRDAFRRVRSPVNSPGKLH